ncbi:MAG: dethiobiotin synthase [Deltaproteobacteria bacterium]|nr:dethiobiotin synthase [Deltaproteobacteria bacterium]
MGGALFITGTDTGVGKTFFTCALAAYLKASGYKVGVMKPAETGCIDQGGQLYAEDAEFLQQASGSEQPIEQVCPYRLPEPLAPSIAAERAGVEISIDHLLNCLDDIKSAHDITLVEGAGGLLVPLLPSYTFADFAGVAKLPLIVVAANKLGAINHLLLTLEQASYKGLLTVGYVLNQLESEPSLAAQTNREVLAGLTGVRCLGEVPFVSPVGSDEAQILELFERELDLRAIDSVLKK